MIAHWDVAAILTTLFMVFAVCYALIRLRARFPSTPLGNMRMLAFAVAVFGTCTFFVPLARTDPPVLSRADWSGLNLMAQVRAGNLDLSAVAFDIAATYLLMLLALVALLLPRPRKALLVISLLGVVCSSWALEMGHDLLFHWFVRSGSTLQMLKVGYAPAIYAIEIVMSVLLLISVSET
jgi:hypothetical protein